MEPENIVTPAVLVSWQRGLEVNESFCCASFSSLLTIYRVKNYTSVNKKGWTLLAMIRRVLTKPSLSGRTIKHSKGPTLIDWQYRRWALKLFSRFLNCQIRRTRLFKPTNEAIFLYGVKYNKTNQ